MRAWFAVPNCLLSHTLLLQLTLQSDTSTLVLFHARLAGSRLPVFSMVCMT